MNGNFTACVRQIKVYWPILLILIIAVIVTLVIIYTKVSSPPLLVYYFGETNTLGTGSNNSFSPEIASSGEGTYIVNIERGRGSGHITMEKIVNNDTLLSPSFSIGNVSANSTSPEVAASGNNVYVVWSDTNGAKAKDREIFFSSSDDNATTFDNPINLSNNVGNSTNPEVAASGNNVYVAWADSRETGTPDKVNLNLKTSLDNGIHFGKRNLINRDVNKEMHLPQIAASDKNVYITLANKDSKEGNPDNFQIILKTSIDNGTEFTNEKGLKKDIDSKTHLPTVASLKNNVYVVWSDTKGAIDGNGDIFFSSSRDNARSFDDPINLSINSANSTNPRVSVSDGSIYILWTDSSSANNEIKYKQIKLVAME